MRRLIQAGLFGAGLTPIDNPELVGRYNKALGELGIEGTGLERFNIDGIGWSPEIADERKDSFYLCAGPANPMGVLVTPDQQNQPLYMPYSSYERDMMEAFFARSHTSIADITSTSFIGLDIDQELTSYETPYDLVLVRYVTLRSVAGGLFDAAKAQRRLVKRFEAEDLSWFDKGLRSELIESGRTWGDLRHRRADIPPFRFDIQSFYTRAFGGTFVLRSSKSDMTILVLEDASLLGTAKHTPCEHMLVRDPKLPELLVTQRFAELTPAWYRNHPEVLADKRETLLASVVCAEDPGINFAGLNTAQKRQWAVRLRGKLPRTFHLLERLSKELEGKGQVKAAELDPELQLLLLRPSRTLPQSEQEVMWRLLCRLQQGTDVVRLYASDKDLFFGEYQTWPDAKKDWAISLIRERYVPRMSR